MEYRYSFLKGGGIIGELMRTMDWDQTSLSNPDSWPESLKSAVSISLNSGFPIAVYWGKDFTLIYNDSYIPILGDKHPMALCSPGPIVWEEIWNALDDQFKAVMSEGKSITAPDSMLLMKRHGYIEECYFDYTLSPIMASDGSIRGVFNAVVETTYKKISERRNLLLANLVLQHNYAHTLDQSIYNCKLTLLNAPEDIPFFLIYIKVRDKDYRLVASEGINQDLFNVKWPVDEVIHSGKTVHLDSITDYLSEPIVTFFPEHCCEALIVPLKHEKAAVSGYMIAGLSPRKQLDSDYQQFIQNVGFQIGTLLNNGFSFEEFLALERQKDTFLSIASHELKTPVTSIKAYAQLVSRALRKASDTKTLDLINKMDEQIGKLNLIITDMLDVTKLNIGRIEFNNIAFDFDEMVTDIVSEVQHSIDSHVIKMELGFKRKLKGDRSRIAQVVSNLISNALKYSPNHNEVLISTGVYHQELRFSIRDYGIGIKKDEQDKIFERFYRSIDEKQYSFPGMGLGLFISGEILKHMGGRIWVDSIENEGSIFYFVLPASLVNS